MQTKINKTDTKRGFDAVAASREWKAAVGLAARYHHSGQVSHFNKIIPEKSSNTLPRKIVAPQP